MKIKNLDKRGYIYRARFIAFHNKLSDKLKAYYEECGENHEHATNPIKPHGIEPYYAWVYGKGDAPANSKGEKLPTIEVLYKKSRRVLDFREEYNKQRKRPPRKISFENQIYGMRSHFNKEENFDQPFVIKDSEYLYGIFLLVEDDLSDVEELKSKGYWSDAATAPTTKKDLAQRLPLPSGIEWSHYLGMYFSIVSAKVKYFIFDVSRFPSPENDQVYYVREQGIRSLDLVKNEPIYEGEVLKLSSEHYAGSLYKPNSDDLLNVIWKPDSDLSATCFRASFQGISKYKGRLLSLEAMMYRISQTQRERLVNNENVKAHILDLCSEDIREDVQNLALYLSFQRRIIASRVGNVPRETNSNPLSPLQLKASGINIREFDMLPGTYRMLQFGFRRNNEISIIQSKFQIEKDGTALLQTVVSAGGRQKTRVEYLKSVLNPSNRPRVLKVCVIAYANNTTNISNFAILDFDMDPPFTGIYSSVGFNAKGVIGGYMAFDRDDSDFEPCKVNTEDLQDFIADEKVRPIYDKLLELWTDRAKHLPFDLGDDD